MPLYTIDIAQIDTTKSDLDDQFITSLPHLEDYRQVLQLLHKKATLLRERKSRDLLTFFDTLAERWLSGEDGFLKQFGHLGITFLINFIRRQNLEPLLTQNLRGNIEHLDHFVVDPEIGKQIMAHPYGVITHWLAGNVPILGMISLIQGILTKNINVVKLPRENGLLLPAMFQYIVNHSINCNDGQPLTGQNILDTLLFVYCDKDDTSVQTMLSKAADVRVAWGGKSAVESVLNYPKKYWAQDAIFGPKYSFAVISKDSVSEDDLGDLAYRLALDASVFEQQGCNSPHTVFIEEGGLVSPRRFAEALGHGMEKVLKRIPKPSVSGNEASTIVTVRAEYDFLGEVYSSQGTEWTVIYSDEEGMADACYSRTLFVRPVSSIESVLPFISHHHQSMGLLALDPQRTNFAQDACARGIERVTEIGKMSVYDHPWDGMFPMDHFVRWVSLYK